MAQYELTDDSVVVVIGSGAGGGTLANELCQKGLKVVLLEAGKRESTRTYVNDEWASFSQLSWLDKRTASGSWQIAKDFPNLPAWTCKTVGGTTVHFAGACDGCTSLPVRWQRLHDADHRRADAVNCGSGHRRERPV